MIYRCMEKYSREQVVVLKAGIRPEMGGAVLESLDMDGSKESGNGIEKFA